MGKVGKLYQSHGCYGIENLANIDISTNDQEKPIPNDQTTNQAIFEALKPLTLKYECPQLSQLNHYHRNLETNKNRTEVLSYHAMRMYSKHC